MIVNYDKANGWSFFGSKKSFASQEAIGFFDNLAKEQQKGLTVSDWGAYAGHVNVADDSLKKFLTDSKYATKDLATYNQYLKDTGKATSGFASMTSKAGSVLKSFGSMALNIGATMAISWAITKGIELAAKAWDKYAHSQENAIEKGTKTLEDHKASIEKLNTASKVVADSGARFEELSRGVSTSGENISLTADEFSEYQSITSQLADSFPELVDGYDSLGNPIITATNSVRELTEALQEQQAAISDTNIANAQDYVEAFNAMNNQIASDFTKEAGYKQQAENVQNLINAFTDTGYAQTAFGADLDYEQLNGFERALRFVTLADTGTANESLYADEIRAIKQIAKDNDIDILNDFGGIDWKKVNTDETIEQFSSILEQITTAQEEAFNQTKALIESTLTSSKVNDVYNSLNEASKTALSSIINGMDYSTGESLGFIDEEGNLDSAAIKNWGNDVVRNLSKSSVQDKLAEFFDLSKSMDEMDYDEYTREAELLMRSIGAQVPELSREVLDSAVGLEDSFKELRQMRADLVQDGISDSYIEELSNADLELLWTLNADDLIHNAEEAKKALEEAKAAAADSPDKYFNEYLAALETENQGSKYDKMLEGYESIKEDYKAGRVGTDDFKAFAAMISPTGSDDMENFEENYGKFEAYFKDSRKGVENFIAKLKEKGYATKGTDDLWDFDVPDMTALAHNLGISSEMAYALFDKMKEYNYDNNIIKTAEEGGTRIGELMNGLVKEQQRLETLTEEPPEGVKGYDTDAGHTIANQTAIDQSREKIRQYNANIEETVANTKSLIDANYEDKESREAAAVSAAKALKAQQDVAREAGLTETVDMIDEQIQSLETRYGSEGFMAKVNFDVESAEENIANLMNSAWHSIESGGKAEDTIAGIQEQVNLLAGTGEDVSSLALQFNDLAAAAGLAFRMNADGTTWDVEDKAEEVAGLIDKIQRMSIEGTRANSQMTDLASMIGDMAEMKVDVSPWVGVFNELAERNDYDYRMEVTGELVAVEDYTGEGVTEGIQVPMEVEFNKEQFAALIEAITGEPYTFTVEPDNPNPELEVELLPEFPTPVEYFLSGMEPVSLETELEEPKIPDINYKEPVKIPSKVEQPKLSTGVPDLFQNVYQELHPDSSILENPPDATQEVNQVPGTQVGTTAPAATQVVNQVQGTTVDTVSDTTGTSNFELGESPEKVPDASGTANFRLGYYPYTVPDVSGKLNLTLGTMPTIPSLTAPLNPFVKRADGTAHIAGTAGLYPIPKLSSRALAWGSLGGDAMNLFHARALASGDWRTKRTETALVGEVGQELVIPPGTNRWYTVGDNGAEFSKIPKGSIVFNNLQTKELFEKGYVTKGGGRGRIAHASGTAGNKIKGFGRALAEGTTSKWANTKDWFENLTAAIEANIEMFKTRADTWQTYKSQNTSINSAIKQTQKLQKANEKAYDMYMSKANSVALSSDLKAKVRDGSINISDYNEGTRQLIQDYEEMYTKARDAKQAAAELKLEIRELAQEKLDNITERFDAITGVKISKNDAIDAQLEYREARGMTYTKGGTYERLLNQKGANLLDVITNLELEQAAYSAELKKAKKTFGASSNQYYEALAVYNEITQELYEQKTAYEENLNTIFELNKTIKDFSISLRERGLDKLNRSTNIKEAQHQIILEEDYLEKIEMANQALVQYSDKIELIKDQMAQVAVHSDEYQELAEELNNVESKQEQLIIDMESWADEIRELDWKPFRDGLEEIDDMIDSAEHLRGLLNEDNFVSIDGSITSDGAANLMLIASAMEGNKQKVADYKVAIQKLNEEYDNGRISEEKYKEELDEYTQGIYDAVNANESYRDSIIEVYEAQLEAENELLQDSIDKYKEKWKVQQDYVKWSRNLEKQNKNINALRAEAAALSGTTSAAGLAKLAQIKAQIKEAEKSLNEDIEDRRYDKISDGLDTLSDDADTVLDSSLDALKRNSQYQEDVVSIMLSNIVDMYSSAYGQINSIIANTGTIINQNLQNNISSDGTQTGQEKVSQTVSNATSSTVGASSNATGINTTKTPTVNAGNQSIVDSMVGTDTVKEAVDDGIVNVDSISISPKSKTLIVGQSITLKAKVTPANARIQTFEWTSSDPSVATVSSSGVVKAIKYGSVTITCASKDRNYSAKKATAKIKVVTKTRSILNNLKGEENNGTSKLNQWLAAAGYGKISRTDAAAIAKDKGLNYKASELMVKGSGKKEQAIIDKLKPALLKEALKALPDETRTKTAVSKLSKLSQYISTTYGKRLTSAGALKLAKLLQVDVSNLDNYDKWTGTDRETVRKALASYKISFAKGGYVGRKNYIPVSKLSDNELAKIVSRGGDSGITGINPGEVILTQRQAEAVLSEIVPTAKTLAETFASVKPLHYDSATPTTSISLHYDSLLTVNGSVDKNALPDLQTLLQKSCDYTTKHISKELLKKGYKH